MLKFLLLLVLINITGYHAYTQENYVLNNAFKRTYDFFKKLKLNHESENLNENVMVKINETIVEYVKSISETIISRHKRQLSEKFNKGIDTLNGLQDFKKLNFRNVQDMKTFTVQNEFELTWFAAILDVFKVTVFKINRDSIHYVTTYPVTNGTRLAVNSCNYGTFLIVQNQDNSIHILRFKKAYVKYYLQLIQDFELNDMTHLTVWNGMNQLYLGIATHSNISIFTWFGDYFDLIQVIHLGTKKLVSFQSKGFMYLAATGVTTLIFKYLFKSNEFLLMQRLPSSQDISFFQLSEGHFIENFLSLSTETYVVIYKNIHGRFVPFQQIRAGKSTIQIISNKAILFFTLHKDTVWTYQYNGWRFIELDVKLYGIDQIHTANLYGKQLLLVKYKNDTWALKQLVWTKKNTYKDLQEEIKAWNIKAKHIAQRTLNEIPNLNNPIKILKGRIDQLFVHSINQHDSEVLKNVTKQYSKLNSRLQEQKTVINNKWHPGNVTVASLYAKKIHIRCKTKCRIATLSVKRNTNLLSKLQMLHNKNEVSNFKTLVVKEIKNWKCPIFSLPIDNIVVNKSINGMLLENLQKNTLKVTGNQKISGEHRFISINVTNASMPLSIASYFAKQEILARKVKVKELTLTEGGLLLPLNGSSTVITGSIKASKVKVKKIIRLQGPITGNLAKELSLIKYIFEPLTVYYNVSLENAKIEDMQAIDLIINEAGSVKDILSNAISLYDNIMPISLIFSNEKTKWNNVTIHGPQKWITVNSQNTITGKKNMLHNVEVTKLSYEKLRFPRIDTTMCGSSIIIPEIKVSVLTVNNVTVKSLKSSHVFGNLVAEYAIDDSAFLFKSLNFSTERYYHNVKAKSIFATDANNINLTALGRFASSWVEPNILKTSIEATDLTINNLKSPMRFYAELSKVTRNMVSKKNTHVGRINNVNFTNFLAHAIKLEDIISLGNITFNNGFTTNHIHTSSPSLPIVQTEKDLNLYKKRISGNIEVNAINLHYFSEYVRNDAPVNIIIKGSAIFPTEPMIYNINNNKLKELLTQIWIVTDDTTFHGRNLYIVNALILGNIILNNPANTLHLETWKNISERVLSKTRVQNIPVDASLNNVETNTIIGSNTSTLLSSVLDLNDMFDNSLMKDGTQDVKAKWTFNKLKILGKMNAAKKINNLNLRTDVMRHDSRNNIITGKKKVVTLVTKNLNGLNFFNWVDNVLTLKKKHVIIKGRKCFLTAVFKNITLSGTVMGHTMDKALLKSANQTVHGRKIIHGLIHASKISIDGLVNDVNLTNLVDRQLKKRSSSQTIETRIELQKGLIITGNLIVNNTYADVNTKNFDKDYSRIPFITARMNEYLKMAEAINLALTNRASYINKLEIVKNVTDISHKDTVIQKEQYQVQNSSKQCINEYVENFEPASSTSNFVLSKSVLLDENQYSVCIKFDFVSIYVYNNASKVPYAKGLYIPGIIDAFVEPMLHSLWIALRSRSQTLVLHYQPWNELQEHALPYTDVFSLSRSPNNQLLLFLSSGVWDLKGLGSPRNIIEFPLQEQVETFVDRFDYFVKYRSNNETILTKARYVGN